MKSKLKNSDIEPFIVGICGGSASGKTKLLNDLQSSFYPEQISVLSLDNYYRPYEEQFIDENGVENFDIPGSIDLLAFAKDVTKLKQGKTISREEYTFNNPNVTPKIIVTKPAPIIVVEGIFIFCEEAISQQINLKIFVDTHDHLMMKRRIIRDAIERNYDMEDVMYRFEFHVMPAYHQYISPYKHTADIVVPNNGTTFANALDVIQAYLGSRLKRYEP